MENDMNYLFRYALSILATASFAFAHVGNHPSIHDTMADILQRLQNTMPVDSLAALNVPQAVSLLTDEERHVLGTEYITFSVNQPVTVTIFRDLGQRIPPYWLEERGFTRTGDIAKVSKRQFEAWQKDFDAGEIGLGVHSFADNGRHYFAVISPHSNSAPLEIANMYPGYYRLEEFATGASIYRDSESYSVAELPEQLNGDMLLVGMRNRSKETIVTGIFRTTPYPSSTKPEQIALTWSEDPKTTQTIQWRTSTEVRDGVVRYRRVGASTQYTEVIARRNELRDRFLLNDPVDARFAVVLRGLEPNTSYEYQVGSPSHGVWSNVTTFTTAPEETTPFSFMYLGDPQNGLDTWGEMIRGGHAKYSRARFWVIAGDLVNRGNQREEWDSFFMNAEPIFRERPVVPALGNHEHQGAYGPWMYERVFNLPENGPQLIPPERGYALEYSNALFLILDSNKPADIQTDWIAEQLENTNATWKFVVYHHPAYSSSPGRDNAAIRTLWGEIFDRYHVDLALQGHDHAYLRTYPMRDGKPVGSPADGTIYIVSVSGTKMYSQGDHPYTEVGFTNVATYQLLDITIDGDKLRYRAFDSDGKLHDELIIEK